MTLAHTIRAGAVLAAFAATAATAAPITVTPTNDASALASALVGGGITISNATYSGAASGAGGFTGGTQAGLGFDTGIVLTSGNASSAGTSFAGESTPSDGVGGPSTPLIASSADAVTLSFNFTSTSTAVSFSYVFASAEYPAYVNSVFNDAFRFLVNDTDIATLPDSSTLVTINNVNSTTNSAFFVNNADGGTNTSIPYGGYTTTLSASFSGLTPGATNSLTLVIADVVDRNLDSAVFIQAGSLTNAPPTTAVPEPATITLLGMGLLGLAARRRKA